MKIFEVEELSFNITGKADKIIFKNTTDLEQAIKEIDDAQGIYVKTNDGLITSLAHRLIYQRVYDGSLLLCALEEKQETSKGRE